MSSVHQFSSVSQSCPTLCYLMGCSFPGFPVHHQLLSLLKLMFIRSVMPPNNFIVYLPLCLLPLIFPCTRVFSNESVLQLAKVLEVQLQHQSFQWIFRTYFLQGGLVGSPCCPRDSQESCPTPQLKSINALVLSFLYGPTLTSTITSGKTIALNTQTFAGKSMSLLFSMLSRFFIALSSKDQSLFFHSHSQYLQWFWSLGK